MFPKGVPEHVAQYDYVLHGADVVRIAFQDLQSEKPLDPTEIAEEFCSGTMYVEGFPKYPETWRIKDEEEREKAWGTYSNAKDTFARTLADRFVGENPDRSFFRLSYADDDGTTGTVMEHGDVFRNLPHHRISHH